MIDHQHVARLIAWCEERTDAPQIREIAAALREMQDERLDVLAALHLPDHGPVDPVEEIRTILRNWDETEDRAAAPEQEHAPGETREEIRLGRIRRHLEICHGALTVAGSRVYVDSLLEYLRAGHPLDEWLEDYPSVPREHARDILRLALVLMEWVTLDTPAALQAREEIERRRRISARTLHMMDESMRHFADGVVGPAVDLDVTIPDVGEAEEEYRDLLGIADEIPDPRQTEEDKEEDS